MSILFWLKQKIKGLHCGLRTDELLRYQVIERRWQV